MGEHTGLPLRKTIECLAREADQNGLCPQIKASLTPDYARRILRICAFYFTFAGY